MANMYAIILHGVAVPGFSPFKDAINIWEIFCGVNDARMERK